MIFLEEIQKAIIFSYKAVESFCNASIPDTYTYKKTTSKGIVEHYGKEQIERWVSTSEKNIKNNSRCSKVQFSNREKILG